MTTQEASARIQIDAQLSAAGSIAQDIAGINLTAGSGVAVREEFCKGNDFCKKVTYRASGKSEDIIKAFRTAPEKRRRLVGVLDGMSKANAARRVSRRAEPANQCLLFLRDVRSQLYFEQMKGRGTRTVDPTDPVKTLTNLITLVHHTVDPQKTPLAPFPELVETRYQQWLAQHQESGLGVSPQTQKTPPQAQTPRFTPAQIHWLAVIKNYVALNGAFATDDQDAYLDAWQSVDSDEGVPLAVANRVFGKDALKPIIEELNEMLVA